MTMINLLGQLSGNITPCKVLAVLEVSEGTVVSWLSILLSAARTSKLATTDASLHLLDSIPGDRNLRLTFPGMASQRNSVQLPMTWDTLRP